MDATLSAPRLLTAGVLLLALSIAAAFLPPLVGLVGLVFILGILIVVETRRYAALRGASSSAERGAPSMDSRMHQDVQVDEPIG